MINIKLFCAQLITLKDDIAVSVKKKKKKNGKKLNNDGKGLFHFYKSIFADLVSFLLN